MRQRVILTVSVLGVILLIWAALAYNNSWEAERLSHVKSVRLINQGNEADISYCQLFGHVDQGFQTVDLDNTVAPENIKVSVYEFKNSATSRQAFNSISHNFDALCLSQNAVIAFCKEHKSELASEPYATLFLLKGGHTYYVAIVGNFGDGLRISLRSFDSEKIWEGSNLNRLVVPD